MKAAAFSTALASLWIGGVKQHQQYVAVGTEARIALILKALEMRRKLECFQGGVQRKSEAKTGQR